MLKKQAGLLVRQTKALVANIRFRVWGLGFRAPHSLSLTLIDQRKVKNRIAILVITFSTLLVGTHPAPSETMEKDGSTCASRGRFRLLGKRQSHEQKAEN